MFDAGFAKRLGLLDRVVDDDELDAEVTKVTDRILGYEEA
jgi:enoyl-CoA hydratase/carnithine racemase